MVTGNDNEKETQDEMIKMKVRTFVGLILSLVIGTNSFSIIYQKVLRTEDQQVYERERSDKKDKRLLEDMKVHTEITNLKRDLNHCINNKH